MKLTKDNAKELYKTANPHSKKILEETYGKEFFLPKITDNINNWSDICILAKIDPVKSLPFEKASNKLEKHLNAVFKINKITEVLNQGVIMDFNNRNQNKWYPWFRKEEISWVVLAFDFNFWISTMGSGCYYKSKEDAEFAVSKFMDIYIDYLPD